MGKQLLEVRGLTKRFGGIAALNGVTFALEAGCVHALIGPNGAGKTTIFNLITSLYPPNSGEIVFCGQPVVGRPPMWIARAGISRTFQNVQLFADIPVVENVMVGRHIRAPVGFWQAIFRTPGFRGQEAEIYRRSLFYLEIVGLGDKADRIAGELPFGEQRLLEIARALATEPRLLLLDEPAAGLNEAETTSLGRVLQRILDMGVTVALVEHDMRLVMGISHRVIVLSYGQIIADGPPEQIRTMPQVVEAYLGRQRHA